MQKGLLHIAGTVEMNNEISMKTNFTQIVFIMKCRLSYVLFMFLFFISSLSYSQTPENYFPHHEGDVWQYHSQFTGELIQTLYFDSLATDSISLNTYIYFHNVYGGSTTSSVGRLDTAGNYFDNTGQLWYKFNADSGETWIVRDVDSIRTDTIIGQVFNVYYAFIFGIYTTVIAFKFEIRLPSGYSYWIGTDHFADGFGLVRQDIEPSDSYLLTGAIIDMAHYGVIVSNKEEISTPQSIEILKNYPNPFNPTTNIEFNTSMYGFVSLKVYNMFGQEVSTITENMVLPGVHHAKWDGKEYPGGIYILRLCTAQGIQTRKMILLR